ncbi:hypothetical protein C8R43DRAFT_621842 [Mycena crocata]|nr:hypothetical protein C8R43DRAFT_621842 [Mycena crocata]
MSLIFLPLVINAFCSSSSPPALLETYLAAGPKGALKAWQSRSSDDLGDVYESLAFPEDADYHTGLFTEYFSRTLGEIWTARNVQSPGRDEGPDKWILDSAHGENDTCSQCADPGGVKLFTQANWSHLPRHYSFGLLKSKLRENRTVSNPFHEMWRKISRSLSDSDDPGRAITDLFELCAAARASTGSRSTNAGSTSAGIDASTSISTATMPALAPEILATLSHASFAAFDGWDVRLSYCGPCLHRFVEAHAWVWWLEEQLKSGWTPPEDCRDGYDCKMQGRQSHAQSANHLCVPSTGEP